MSLKPGYEHLKVTPEMAALMRATLLEHYFHPQGDVAVYDPHDAEKQQLLAAWLGNNPVGGAR